MESEYLISRRQIMLGLKSVPEKPKPKPIQKRSDKMKDEMKVYIPAAKEFLSRPENKKCRIKMQRCTWQATVIHHSAGRTGHKLHDQEDWIPSCQNCNLSVEIKDLEARELGVKKSKFKV